MGARFRVEAQSFRFDRSSLPMGGTSHGRRRVDNRSKQLRAGGDHEQARNRSEGEGLDRICPDRSCSGSRTGWTAAAADCALDLWQCQRWHAAHASVQTIGIDLPLKALVWQDVSGATWLSYNDPAWLAKRHGASHDVDGTVTALTGALHAFAKAATGAQ